MHRTHINQLHLVCVLAICLNTSPTILGTGNGYDGNFGQYTPYPSYASALQTPSYINPYAVHTTQQYTPYSAPHNQFNGNNDVQRLHDEFHQLMQQDNTLNGLGNTTFTQSITQAISQPLNPQALTHFHDDTQKLHDEFRELMQQNSTHDSLTKTTFSQLLAEPTTAHYQAKRTHTHAFPIDEQNNATQLLKRMRACDNYATDQMKQPQINALSLSECMPQPQTNILTLQAAAATQIPSLLTPGHTHTLPIRATQHPGSQKKSEVIVRNTINRLAQERYMLTFDLDKQSDNATVKKDAQQQSAQHTFTYKRFRRNYAHSNLAIRSLIESGNCPAEKFMELITAHKIHPSHIKGYASLFAQGIDAPEIQEVITQLEKMNTHPVNGLRYNPADYIKALTHPSLVKAPEKPSAKSQQNVLHIKKNITHSIKNVSQSSFEKNMIEEFVRNNNPSPSSFRCMIAEIKSRYTQDQLKELGEHYLKNPLQQVEFQTIIETLLPGQLVIDHFKSIEDISATFKKRNSQFIHKLIPHLNNIPVDTFHILEEKRTAKGKSLDSTIFRYAAQSIAKHHPNSAQKIITHLQHNPLTDSATQQLVIQYLQKKTLQ